MYFDEKRTHIRELVNGGKIKALILFLVCSVKYSHTYTYVVYSEINKGIIQELQMLGKDVSVDAYDGGLCAYV